MTYDELFERELRRWGLRGDPRLWRAMAESLHDAPMAESDEQLQAVLRRAFRHFVGSDIPESGDTLADPDWIYVERFAIGSGMSDGRVSPGFWRDTAIPILLDRYLAARAAEARPRGWLRRRSG